MFKDDFYFSILRDATRMRRVAAVGQQTGPANQQAPIQPTPITAAIATDNTGMIVGVGVGLVAPVTFPGGTATGDLACRFTNKDDQPELEAGILVLAEIVSRHIAKGCSLYTTHCPSPSLVILAHSAGVVKVAWEHDWPHRPSEYRSIAEKIADTIGLRMWRFQG